MVSQQDRWRGLRMLFNKPGGKLSGYGVAKETATW